ncbi:hypothetical protein MFIFM68171_04743 [Madurella fahalii]|uniref:Peptidase A1 domain-containing protein n=1 Tax=Madurella fahalii TaxID=1157608 RepID=A0ABQ0G9T4_9PEZI
MHSAALLWTFAILTASSSGEDTTTDPGPLVIPASQYFEGNDGPWSTFDIRVGTPEQYIRVLVSTASPHSLVPLAERACSDSVFAAVPPDCAVSRGNLFNPNQSSTWRNVGRYGINQNGVGLEANLGYNQRVQFGLDRLGIGLTGPSIEGQIVGGIATAEPFYTGIFGLNNQPMNFSELGNHRSQVPFEAGIWPIDFLWI